MKPSSLTRFKRIKQLYIDDIDAIVTFFAEIEYEPEQVRDMETQPFNEDFSFDDFHWFKKDYTPEQNIEIATWIITVKNLMIEELKEEFEGDY